MNKRIPILLGLMLVFIACSLLIIPNKFARQLYTRLDLLGYDIQLRTHVLTEKRGIETPIAIIDIDDQSLQAEGHWPWPRHKLAQLVDALHQEGAAVIAFDILFAEPEINIALTLTNQLTKERLLTPSLNELLTKAAPLFDNDVIFAKSIARSETLLALGFLPSTKQYNVLPPPLFKLMPIESAQLGITENAGYIANIPILQAAAKGAGFINISPDVDGIIRRSPLVMEYQQGIYPSLALLAVMRFLNSDIELITHIYDNTKKLEGIRIANRIIPTDEHGRALIPFVGESYTVPYYSATDVLHHRLPTNALLGKILFVGTSALGSGDLKPTAIQNPFPGVEIQATLVNGILLNKFSYKPAWALGANLFLTLLFGVLGAIIFPYLGPRILGLIIFLFPTSLLLVNNLLWSHTGLILSVLMPVFLVNSIAIFNILYGYLFETRRREHLKEMFSQYVPEKFINVMLKTTNDYGLRGENRDMSVLFADIRDFTAISEDMPASELVKMLNDFFTPMTEVIFHHHGTIDKYVGDLIMAFWGAPLKNKHHAEHALKAALGMQLKLQEMQTMLQEKHWPEIKIGIGINSGQMNVGNMGSRYRRNYTVMGDAVNLASRVESLTKYYGVGIIVTETTRADQHKFIFRKLDKMRVKGKKNGVAIYELVCHQHDLTPEMAHELELYHQALDHYYQVQWQDSLALFNELQAAHPDTKIYQIYIERLQALQKHPVPHDWDGIFTHTAK